MMGRMNEPNDDGYSVADFPRLWWTIIVEEWQGREFVGRLGFPAWLAYSVILWTVVIVLLVIAQVFATYARAMSGNNSEECETA
jgi:uncharacterized membrane protein